MKLTNTQITELIEASMNAASQAYMPYSEYAVGAAVLCEDGSIICGANIENSSYPVSICAERVAISSALSMGYRKISAIAVYTSSEDISPCGMCRQFISEFGEDILVVFKWGEEWRSEPINKLLPYAFSARNLK
jgi:cytidine deaminase